MNHPHPRAHRTLLPSSPKNPNPSIFLPPRAEEKAATATAAAIAHCSIVSLLGGGGPVLSSNRVYTTAERRTHSTGWHCSRPSRMKVARRGNASARCSCGSNISSRDGVVACASIERLKRVHAFRFVKRSSCPR